MQVLTRRSALAAFAAPLLVAPAFAQGERREVVVEILADGALRVDDAAATLEALPEAVRRAGGSTDRQVNLRIDASAPYPVVQSALVALQDAGFRKLALLSREGRGQPTTAPPPFTP